MTELVVERNTLLENLDNDTQLLKEVIGIFLADCPGRLMDLRVAVATHNSDQIASASHSLRGSVSTFGAKTAVEAAHKLESMGRQGKLEGLDEAFAVLEHEMVLVTFALEEIAKNVSDGCYGGVARVLAK